MTIEKFFPKIKVHDLTASPRPLQYRHKIQLPFGLDQRTGAPVLGIHAHDYSRIIDQQECMIQHPVLTMCVQIVRKWVAQNNLSVYNHKSDSGELKFLVGRLNSDASEVLLGLVTSSSRIIPDKLIRDLASQLEEALPSRLAGILQNINPRKTSMALGYKNRTLWGKNYLQDRLGKTMVRFELSTFVQINPYVTPLLYNHVRSAIPAQSRILDLYSGIGSIAFWIEDLAKSVTAIESNPLSVRKGIQIARANGLQHKIKFIASDAARGVAQFPRGSFDVVIIDPPRQGAEAELLSHCLHLQAPLFIYVSCNPETLARDADLLQQNYQLLSVQPVDMFPFTDQIETVALFALKKVHPYPKPERREGKNKL